MSVSPDALTLLADLAGRGFQVRPVGGQVRVSPASALTDDDRQAIRLWRDDLMHLLAPCEPWIISSVVEWTCDADDLVLGLGLSVTHPSLLAAAMKIVALMRLKHMSVVRAAVGEFVALTERLANETPDASLSQPRQPADLTERIHV